MNFYKTKYTLLPGSLYGEVVADARKTFNAIRSSTKRSPYLRSKYFKSDKVFLTIFWDHVMQKPEKDRLRRLRFYRAALDLIRNTSAPPVNKLQGSAVFHRFYGQTGDDTLFCVQIKQDITSGRKDFMSIFPVNKNSLPK